MATEQAGVAQTRAERGPLAVLRPDAEGGGKAPFGLSRGASYTRGSSQRDESGPFANREMDGGRASENARSIPAAEKAGKAVQDRTVVYSSVPELEPTPLFAKGAHANFPTMQRRIRHSVAERGRSAGS